jgi:hypothetical protein
MVSDEAIPRVVPYGLIASAHAGEFAECNPFLLSIQR